MFEKQGTMWVETAKLTASDAASGDEFGISVSLSGDTALVGAYADDGATGTDSGAAYEFWLGPCLSEPNPGVVYEPWVYCCWPQSA